MVVPSPYSYTEYLHQRYHNFIQFCQKVTVCCSSPVTSFRKLNLRALFLVVCICIKRSKALLNSPGSMEKQQQQQQQQQQPQKQHFHVLAVDDSLLDRKLLERLLKISSYQVTCVESGNKALEYLGLLDHDNSQHSSSSQQEGMKVNLIITDYCMPGMSGYDLLKRVKKSSWKHIPVVVMSSENVPSRVTMCLEGGAEEFLLKPLQLSDVKKIQSYLLKSIDHSYTNGGGIGLIDSNNNSHTRSSSSNKNDISTTDIINKDNTNDGNNSGESNINNGKRKATAPQAPDRRPKIKA